MPGTFAVHWLSATACGTRLVVVAIRATIAVVSSTFAVRVGSASFVLVVTAIMIAASISAPSSNTVNRLTAATRDARFVVVAVWAALAIVSSTFAILVGSAPPVLMVLGNVSTRSIRAPSSNAVHRLTATTKDALLLIVAVRAGGTIVCCIRADRILPATDIFAKSIVVAVSISTPSSNTVDRLATTTRGTR